MPPKRRVAVLISGNGSNLQALIDAAKSPDYPAEISLVISNKSEVYGLTRAQHENIPHRTIMHQDYPDRESFDRAMHAALQQHYIELVCLAGFMRLLSPWFVQQWQGKLLNIHPSLLPNFKGGHAVRDALAAGVKTTGCTVHLVTEEMDEGPVIAQISVPVMLDDTIETLHQRIHDAEHALYPEAVKELIMKLK